MLTKIIEYKAVMQSGSSPDPFPDPVPDPVRIQFQIQIQFESSIQVNKNYQIDF